MGDFQLARLLLLLFFVHFDCALDLRSKTIEYEILRGFSHLNSHKISINDQEISCSCIGSVVKRLTSEQVSTSVTA